MDSRRPLQLSFLEVRVSVNIKMHIFYQIRMYSFHQEDSSVAAYIWARRKDFPFIGTTVA